MANGLFGGGNGTYQNPFIIDDAYDLIATQKYLKTRNFYYYKLSRDINLGVYPFNTGKGWKPLLNLIGCIDGDNHTIYNLYINRPKQNYVGLFERIDVGYNMTNKKNDSYTICSAIKNLSFKNANVTGKSYVGVICGQVNELTKPSSGYAEYTKTIDQQFDYLFQNCEIDGKVSGEDYVGGAFGLIDGLSFHFNSYSSSGQYINYSIRFMRNIHINANIVPLKAGQFFGSVFGCGGAICYECNKVNVFKNVVSTSAITNVINGKKDYNFLPMSFGYSTSYGKYTNGFINCYYNTDTWCGINSSGYLYESDLSDKVVAPIGLTAKQIKDPNHVLLSHEIDAISKSSIWYFPPEYSEKNVELRSFQNGYYYIKCDDEYYIYKRNKWEKVFDKAPTAYEAMNNAMSSISNIPLESWKELKDKNYTSVSVVMYSKYSEGTTRNISLDNIMEEYADKTNTNNNKKYVKKSFSFSNFGDNIVSIEKGAAK